MWTFVAIIAIVIAVAVFGDGQSSEVKDGYRCKSVDYSLAGYECTNWVKDAP